MQYVPRLVCTCSSCHRHHVKCECICIKMFSTFYISIATCRIPQLRSRALAHISMLESTDSNSSCCFCDMRASTHTSDQDMESIPTPPNNYIMHNTHSFQLRHPFLPCAEFPHMNLFSSGTVDTFTLCVCLQHGRVCVSVGADTQARISRYMIISTRSQGENKLSFCWQFIMFAIGM